MTPPPANTGEVRAAEVVLPCGDLQETLDFFIDLLGFRLDAIRPADSPAEAVVSGYGVRLRLERGAASAPGLLRLLCRDPAAVARHLSAPGVDEHLAAWRDRIETVQPFDAPTLEAALREIAEQRGIKAGTLIHATRVAITGQTVSPGLFEVMELMGRDRVLDRLSPFAAAGGRR